MVAPVNGNGSNVDPAKALASATQSNQALGKDAFLKLLVAQMSHQDPLKPMDDTAFVAQLAQFSNLEQSMGINTRLDALAAQERGGQNTQLAGLVGKNITVRGNLTTLDSAGVGAPIAFSLANASQSVDINISDSSGKAVRTMHLGAGAAGLVRATWDGRDSNGLMQPPGAYAVSVVAKGEGGVPVDVSQETTGNLKSISFEKGYPNLLLDNGVSAPSSDLLRINSGTK